MSHNCEDCNARDAALHGAPALTPPAQTRAPYCEPKAKQSSSPSCSLCRPPEMDCLVAALLAMTV